MCRMMEQAEEEAIKQASKRKRAQAQHITAQQSTDGYTCRGATGDDLTLTTATKRWTARPARGSVIFLFMFRDLHDKPALESDMANLVRHRLLCVQSFASQFEEGAGATGESETAAAPNSQFALSATNPARKPRWWIPEEGVD
jgi:hypothetical protein